MVTQDENRIEQTIEEIRSLHPRIERIIDSLKRKDGLENAHINESNAFNYPEYLRILAFSEGLIKLRLIIEQNFFVINTFIVLSTTRYILELLIWYRLLSSDVQRYACCYQAQMISDQLQHSKALLTKARAEIEFFEDIERQERDAHTGIVRTASRVVTNTPQENARSLNDSLKIVSDKVDRLAKRRFSMYLEQAKRNGYGLQAHMMKQQIVPLLEQEIKKLENLREKIKEQIPSWPKKKWNWTEEAISARLSDQFDFIYGYTSRLLHARPVSFNTNQKNLELNEISMFLDFIYVSILEMMEISERLVGLADSSSH